MKDKLSDTYYPIGIKYKGEVIMIKLPKHLRGKSTKEIVEFLANKMAYHLAISDVYKIAIREVKENKIIEFEDDDNPKKEL